MCYWRENADDAWVIQSVQQSAPLLEQVLSQPITVRVSSRFHADNPETVCQAAVVGLGIALLPGYVCTEALRSKKTRSYSARMDAGYQIWHAYKRGGYA